MRGGRVATPPADYLILGDTARAIEALKDRYDGHSRFNSNSLHTLWRPDLDPIRDHPAFRIALAGILDYAGLTGAELRRASPGP